MTGTQTIRLQQFAVIGVERLSQHRTHDAAAARRSAPAPAAEAVRRSQGSPLRKRTAPITLPARSRAVWMGRRAERT